MLPEFFLPRRPVRMDWPAKPPAAPRRRWWDWRTLVGGTGRAMIGAGLLLFGFVGYQLWGTGIQQARSQDRLGDRFSALLDAVSTTAAPTPTTTVGPSTATSTATATATTTPAPTAASPSTLPTTAAPRVAPKVGEPIARILIPSIGVDQWVVSGVGTEELKKAPGHYPDTPLPGELGNAAIAGHRSTFGAPFERVDELDPGDQIEVITTDGRFVYRVTGSRVVEPTEVSVIGPTTDAVLTLTSCWPKFSADKRIVVRAELDPGAGRAAIAPASTLAPTTSASPPVAGSTVTTLPGEVTPATTAATTAATAAAAAAAADDTASTDAFRLGWWSDEGAWGDVVLWGALLAGVALAAWRLSRRTRRNWVGALAGIVPFVVALYFFYENAARLLPPNI